MSPVVLLSICFVLGIGLGTALPVPWEHVLPVMCACAMLTAVSVRIRRLEGMCLLVAVLVLGWIRVPVPLSLWDETGPPCERVVEGTVLRPPSVAGDGDLSLIEIHRNSACLTGPTIGPLRPVSGMLWLRTVGFDGAGRLERGNRVRLRGRVGVPVNHSNPGARPSEGPRDKAMTLRDPGAIQVIGVPTVRLRSVFDHRRWALAAQFETFMKPDAAKLAKALLLGETADLPFAVKDRFRRTGCAHLLAVSGLHLGLVAAFVFVLIRRALLWTPAARRMEVGRIAAGFAAAAAIAFTFITGARTPVVRACIMACSALIARIIQRPGAGIEAFLLAAAVILCGDPRALTEAGFQLSFSAVAAFFFVFAHRRLDGVEVVETSSQGRLYRLSQAASRFLRASCAAVAATGPIALFHFGTLSYIAPLANVIAVPLTELVVMPLLLGAVLLGAALPQGAAFLLKPAECAVRLLDGFVAQTARLPCTVASPNALQSGLLVAACFVVLAAATYVRSIRGLLLPTVVVAVLALGIGWSRTDVFEPRRLTVHFLDVGQGDCTLLTSPAGRHVLVDGGPRGRGDYDAGERIVVPALRALGVSSLYAAAATHPDADHIGGIGAVLRRFQTEQLFDNGQGRDRASGTVYGDLIDTAREMGVPIRRTPGICGMHPFDGATLQVLHPCDWKEGFNPDAPTNDNSLVMAIQFKSVRLLLLGDIGENVERELIAKGRIGETDILKSAHHGSKTATSAALLDAAHPAYDIISAGRYNRFGMPHRSVLSRLTERHIRILRTDELGAIRIQTDGRIIKIASVVGLRTGAEK